MLGLFIAGCMLADGKLMDSEKHASKPNNHTIEIFDKKDIKRDYIVIGNVNEPVKDGQDADEAIERLKVKARKLGGDALFNLRKESVSGTAEFGIGSVRYRSIKTFLTAKVIVWK